MSFSLLLIAASAILVVSTTTPTQSHMMSPGAKTSWAQQPLLYHRREVNPHMNSLFFGKKRAVDLTPSVQELKIACTRLMAYLNKVEQTVSHTG